MTDDVTLAEVCEITMGQAPKGDTYNSEGRGLPLLAGAGDFGELHPRPKKFTTAVNARQCQQGDLILGIRATIGKKVLSDGVYCLGRGVAGLRPKAGLDHRYLWHWVGHTSPVLAAKGRGATFLQVNKADVSELRIALPSIEEQRRIAAILDAADALRVKRREAIAKLATLTQAIFIDMFGDPLRQDITGSQSTSPSRLGNLAYVRTGKLDANASSETGQYPFFTCAVSPLRIDVAAYDTKAVLVAGNGDLNVKYYEGKFNAYQRTYIIDSLDEEVAMPRFLHGFLDIYVGRLREQAIGGVIKYIKLGYLTDAEVPLPSLGAQVLYTKRVEAFDALRATVAASSEQLDVFFSSLQQRAFRGEL